VYPPAHLLPQLARALGVTTNQLLGVKEVKRNGSIRDTRLWRRFSQVEKLPPAEPIHRRLSQRKDIRKQVKGGYLSIGQVEIVRYKPNAEAVFRGRAGLEEWKRN